MSNKTHAIAAAAIVGAAYAVLTIALAPISYGPIQLRVSEVFCILPYFMPGTAGGLFFGCAAANLLTGNIFDVVFGSLATLAAGLCTAYFGKKQYRASKLLACLMPVFFNAVVVGAVITRAYNGMSIIEYPGAFALNAAQVGAGEALVMLAIGLPLMHYLPKQQFFADFVRKTR